MIRKNLSFCAVLMALLLTHQVAGAAQGNVNSTKNAHIYGSNAKSVVIPFLDRVTAKTVTITTTGQAVTDAIIWTPQKRAIVTAIKYWAVKVTTDASPGNTWTLLVEETLATDAEIGTTAALEDVPVLVTVLDATLTNTALDAGDTVAITITDAGTADIDEIAVQIYYNEIETDLNNRAVWQPNKAVTITGIYFIGLGTMTAAAAPNDLVVTILDEGANIVVTKTYVAALGADTPTTLGTVDTTYRDLASGEHVEITTLAGGTAVLPNFAVQIDYVLNDS